MPASERLNSFASCNTHAMSKPTATWSLVEHVTRLLASNRFKSVSNTFIRALMCDLTTDWRKHQVTNVSQAFLGFS